MTSCWLDITGDDDFGIHNLPYGVVQTSAGDTFPAVRIGGFALPLAATCERLLPGHQQLFIGNSLDQLLAAGPEVWAVVRGKIIEWLSRDDHRPIVEPLLRPLADLTLRLPFTVADYVDFYASEDHATNVGKMFRPNAEPLTPNWKHLPIGYHGRAGTVIVSGSDVIRPQGQHKAGEQIVFGATARLDIEAEIGFIVGTGSERGTSVPIGAFSDHVFGLCLLNDWSARDLQAWEYVPLGPFLGKSFATSISGWITPLAALNDARVAPPSRDPKPLPYLDDSVDPWALDISIEVRLNGDIISRPPFRSMYWTGPQMLAHLTVNGASLRTGDLYGSGTVSGPHKDQRGSLLELSWAGEEPVQLSDGTTRSFLHDGDEVVITATAPGSDGSRVGIGEVAGRVKAASG